MRQIERIDDLLETLNTLFDAREADIWTAGPGIIQSFDADLRTCVVQPSIQAKVTKLDGTVQLITIATLLDVPVYFPGGGGFQLTFPIVKGDECLVVFGQRCIDAWWYYGGVQAPAEIRMHDPSDGFAFVGFRSRPRKIAVSTTTTQLVSDDGKTLVELTPGGLVNIKAPGGVNINGVTIDAQGNVVTKGNLSANDVIETVTNVHLSTHKHPTAATGAPSSPTPGT